MKKKGKIYIGTSGWSYKHWNDTFYPETVKVKDQFHYYQSLFNTVEINSSFYRLPSAKTVKHWADSVSKGFLFSVKASRYITHLKKLHDTDASVDEFLQRLASFKATLGPVLFQLPPNMKYNEERLRTFISALPEGYKYVFEFRNKEWYRQEVYDVLSEYNCAFCIFELAGQFTPELVTTNFVYIRLHGPGQNKYQGSYTDIQLKKWADKCRAWQKQSLDVFLYFDNDEKGYAAFNAESLKEMLS